MIDEKLQIAVDTSNIILDKLKEQSNDDKMVQTSRIINLVKAVTNSKIGIDYISFKENGLPYQCGAMMRVDKENSDDGLEYKKASIFINSDMDNAYQRFSLVHELGHLMTERYNTEANDGKYTMSTHIVQDVFSINKKAYDKNDFLLNEQIANVFALRVLIPFEKLRKELRESGDLDAIATSFGVTKEAIISRIALGA